MLTGIILSPQPCSGSSWRLFQTLDLTELDWSPEMWIACHDADQQNARLARHIWEDNGLDVPENFFTGLRPFLGTTFSRQRFSIV